MQREQCAGQLVLLCHKMGILPGSLATWASIEFACHETSYSQSHSSDRVFDVALRPDREIRVGESFWVLQLL